jgi:hypothetical protein
MTTNTGVQVMGLQRYAVVRDCEMDNQKKFTLYHDSLETAKAEAERLCRKERARFIVLKVVAMCDIGEMPVKWEE